jgi:ATP-dependent Zn protease
MVYQLYKNCQQQNDNVETIDCLKDKKINHVSFDPSQRNPIFSSLFNKNRTDDKSYYLVNQNNLQEIDLSFVPSDCRIVNIFSSCGNGTMYHLGFYFLFFFLSFILLYFFFFH